MRKIVKFLTSKVFLLGIFFLSQLLFLIYLLYKLSLNSYVGIYIHIFFFVLSIFVILHLLSSDINPEFKIGWIIPITLFPLFGTFFYMFYRSNNVRPRHKKKYNELVTDRTEILNITPSKLNFKEIRYLNNNGWRYYNNTKTTYINSGEEKLEMLVKDLKNAEKFIFLEYFIITKGYMYNEIINVLIEKAKEGIEVKIIYDDFGSADRLPFNFRKKMEKVGIEVIPFNKMTFHINFALNYRTHRKVVVIDNKIGYSGGINIGDEYINKVKKFGHWKDAAIKIEGEAVWSMTVGFLEDWAFMKKKRIDINKYKLETNISSNEVVAPFGDNPIEDKQLTRVMLLYMINEAKEEINITTPYLIVDNELKTALRLAALSGVKVNIIIPGIPDKRLVYLATESNAFDLQKYGVNIYKYKPGFIHSKTFVVDNEKALIGTTNLDYRSLYYHFENNVYIHNSKTVSDMTNSFKETLEECYIPKPLELKKRSFIKRLVQAVVVGFSSLL